MSRGEGARTLETDNDPKLCPSFRPGLSLGELTKKLVGFAVYSTQVVDRKDDKARLCESSWYRVDVFQQLDGTPRVRENSLLHYVEHNFGLQW